MKNIKLGLLILSLMTVLTGCQKGKVTSESQMAEVTVVTHTIKESEYKTDEKSQQPIHSDVSKNAPFKLTVLDVGQGLSCLIEADGEYMLYDGGDRDASSYVVSYLKKKGINDIKYMVVSHYHDDHLNGLVGVLSACKVGIVIKPDYKAESWIYDSFHEKLAKSGAEVVIPKVNDKFSLGNGEVTVLSADYGALDENDRSISVKFEYGEVSFIITGDAEEPTETLMLKSGVDLKSDIYIVGHHGSSSSSSPRFLDAVKPEFAIISCGEKNDYGHPHKETMDALEKRGIELFRTDKQGEVKIFSDGDDYWFGQVPSDDYSEGETVTPETIACSDTEFVLNTHSMKIHRTSCESVANVSDRNKQKTEKTLEQLVSEGYSPCRRCLS